jgi:hypothetical protein
MRSAKLEAELEELKKHRGEWLAEEFPELA